MNFQNRVLKIFSLILLMFVIVNSKGAKMHTLESFFKDRGDPIKIELVTPKNFEIMKTKTDIYIAEKTNKIPAPVFHLSLHVDLMAGTTIKDHHQEVKSLTKGYHLLKQTMFKSKTDLKTPQVVYKRRDGKHSFVVDTLYFVTKKNKDILSFSLIVEESKYEEYKKKFYETYESMKFK